MDIFKKFFEENPQKVLGDIKDTTDRFGNPDIEVVGDLDNLDLIDLDDSLIPDVSLSSEAVQNQDEQDQGTVSETDLKLLEKSKKQDKELRSKSGQPKKKRLKQKKLPLVITAKPDVEIYSVVESFEKLNPNFKTGEIEAWVYYRVVNDLPMSESWNKFKEDSYPDSWLKSKVEQGYLCYDSNEGYVPSVLYYSGNIYQRISDLIQSKSSYISKLGEDSYESQLNRLIEVRPKALVFSETESKRLRLNYRSKFIREFSINHYGEETTIYAAFKKYLMSLNKQDYKYYTGTSWDLTGKIIDGKRPSINKNDVSRRNSSGELRSDDEKKDIAGFQKDELMRTGAAELEYQMDKFIQNELESNTKDVIEKVWNKEHNGWVDPVYNKIPLGFSYNKLFKNGPLEMRKEQREGAAFIQAQGNGILAFDVGIGKTMTAILAAGQAIENGECLRPLIAVPNPTYFKWIAEINGSYDDNGDVLKHGILPQYPLYNLYNLAKPIQKEIIDESGNLTIDIPEKSITIVSYEGLKKIGFSENVKSDFFIDMVSILGQEDLNITERERARQNEKIEEFLGSALESTIIDIDEIGWDYFVMDEAHNANHIFEGVKGEQFTKRVWSDKEFTFYDKVDRETSPYRINQTSSALGKKAFFISNYIQRNNSGRNVCLLTATPFANNPLELFSILALTNYSALEKLGINSIRSFFDNFVSQTYERVVKSDGSIKFEPVIKGWNNKVGLQKLFFSYMLYKDGSNGSVKRPTKHTLPKLFEQRGEVRIPLPENDQKTTFLRVTSAQKAVIEEISIWLLEQLSDEELRKKAPYLVADTKSKLNSISPMVYYGENPSTIDPVDFIESSPKLKYTMKCIESVKNYQESRNEFVSGQVIYINGAKEYLPLIKDYLINDIGYQDKINGKFGEVEIITGDTKAPDKEKIKEMFLNGSCKIIIGTSTIKEGIDLQDNASCLYNLWIDWNPTDYKQLEGRIWRYGNVYQNVRITTPLLIGSSDAFTYQKLEEKTARINDIFDRNDKSNILEVKAEDREAVKWSLIDNVEELAKMQIQDETEELRKKVQVLEGRTEELDNYESLERDYATGEDVLRDYNRKYFDYLPSDVKSVETDELGMYKLIRANHKDITVAILDMDPNKSYGSLYSSFNSDTSSAMNHVKAWSKVKNKFESMNLMLIETYGEKAAKDISSIRLKINDDITSYQTKITEIGMDEYFNELVDKISEEKKKANANAKSFDEVVKDFTSMNYLLEAKGEEKPVKKKVSKPKPKPLPTIDKVVEAKESEKAQLLDAIDTFEELLKDETDSEGKAQLLDAIDTFKELLKDLK